MKHVFILLNVFWIWIPGLSEAFLFPESEDISMIFATGFLHRMRMAICVKDKFKLGQMFYDEFEFDGCEGQYGKATVIDMLLYNPDFSKLEIHFNTSHFVNGNYIKSTVVLRGIGSEDVTADFVLLQDKINVWGRSGGWRLAYGKLHNCHSGQRKLTYTRESYLPPSDDSSHLVVERFLQRMDEAINSKKKHKLEQLFLDEFKFYGCKGHYDKVTVIQTLLYSPATSQLEVHFNSSHFINYNVDIQYTVVVRGIGSEDVVAEFILIRDNIGSFWRLGSGRQPSCPSRKFAAFDDPSEVLTAFLERVRRTIEMKDVYKIVNLFEMDFEFRGCKATYNRDQIASILLKIPTGTKFSFTSDSYEDHGNTYSYRVTTSGIGGSNWVADFVWNKSTEKLERGSVPYCSKGRV
ncbi:Protein CBG22197 [Caenorhabditis briggsae]|uniref:Protein CBG22197 n=2 Tax=Caenorhabditis briggsae TaxID=6238 RepID=A8Y1S0_CAEBR|nr:Protein CBG22197 [Caenorhabditis briggsae]ULU09763.1 hypothetical protein L3Y34_014263 [Caenorhabditis briggsae]CAP38840.2 Protein CBG22197 [Caenorhabditis briggsae]